MSTPERIAAFQRLIERLPLPHQFLLLYLLDMLSIFAQNDDVNLMSASNLAAVFTPGMLSHPSHDLDPIQYKISQRVVEFLIEFHMCFNMPHATALHKDPVTHPSATQLILPPQQHTPQEVVLNDSEKLKNKASSGTLGSQSSNKTITQHRVAPADCAASFMTPDQLSMSAASSVISALDKPVTTRSEGVVQPGTASSSSKFKNPLASIKQIMPKTSSVDLPTTSNGRREVPGVPEPEEDIDESSKAAVKRNHACKLRIINLSLRLKTVMIFISPFSNSAFYGNANLVLWSDRCYRIHLRL
jgi:hypothetical protein